MQANFNGTEFDNLYISKPLVEQVQNLQQEVVTNKQSIQQLGAEIEEFTNENIDLTLDSMKYQYLYDNVLKDLDKFMILFRDGSLNVLSEEITRDYTQDTGLEIINYRYNGDNIIQEQSLYDISKNNIGVPSFIYNHKKDTFFNMYNILLQIFIFIC